MKRLRSVIADTIAFMSALICLASLVVWIQAGMRQKQIPVLFVPRCDDRIAMFRISCDVGGLRLDHYIPFAHPLPEPAPGSPNLRQFASQLPPDRRLEFPLGIIIRRGSPWFRTSTHSTTNRLTMIGTSSELTLPYWLTTLASALWLGWRIAGALRRRKQKRLRTGACLNCGYLLTGNTSGVCPECGTKITQERAE